MKSQATKNQEPQSLALSLFLSLLNNLLTTDINDMWNDDFKQPQHPMIQHSEHA